MLKPARRHTDIMKICHQLLKHCTRTLPVFTYILPKAVCSIVSNSRGINRHLSHHPSDAVHNDTLILCVLKGNIHIEQVSNIKRFFRCINIIDINFTGFFSQFGLLLLLQSILTINICTNFLSCGLYL